MKNRLVSLRSARWADQVAQQHCLTAAKKCQQQRQQPGKSETGQNRMKEPKGPDQDSPKPPPLRLSSLSLSITNCSEGKLPTIGSGESHQSASTSVATTPVEISRKCVR
jgi:hypothetical protein